MDKAETGSTREHISAHKVAPTEATNKSREDEAAGKNECAVPAVLPPDDLVLAQVADIRNTRLPAGLDEHPPNVRPPKAFMRVVGVERCVGVTVVSTVATSPPADRTLNGTAANQGEPDAERQGSRVGAVSPETVITCEM